MSSTWANVDIQSTVEEDANGASVCMMCVFVWCVCVCVCKWVCLCLGLPVCVCP